MEFGLKPIFIRFMWNCITNSSILLRTHIFIRIWLDTIYWMVYALCLIQIDTFFRPPNITPTHIHKMSMKMKFVLQIFAWMRNLIKRIIEKNKEASLFPAFCLSNSTTARLLLPLPHVPLRPHNLCLYIVQYHHYVVAEQIHWPKSLFEPFVIGILVFFCYCYCWDAFASITIAIIPEVPFINLSSTFAKKSCWKKSQWNDFDEHTCQIFTYVHVCYDQI